MNKEEPYRDQAERLKQRIEKINDEIEDSDQLPPREQIHRQKKKKTKWKLKYPVIRLLVLCFILLPIIIFSVISYRDGAKKVNGTEKSSGNSVGYETINLENQDNEADKSDEPQEIKQNDAGLTDSGEATMDDKVESEQAESSKSDAESVLPPSPKTDGQITDKNSQQKSKTSDSQTNTPSKKTVKVVYHTVQPKETLFGLAKKYYNSQRGIEIIKNANHLQNDQIQTGQVLKIPLNN